MKSILLIVNRHARRAGDPRWQDALRERLSRRFDVEVVRPDTIGDLETQAGRAVERGCHAVVVAAGDGTIGRVANVLADTGVALGVVPLGTGNDLARTLELPKAPLAAADRLADATPRRIDLVEVNGRCFATVGLVGLPAEAALVVDRLTRPGTTSRKLVHATGGLAYRLAGVQALLSAKARARGASLHVGEGVSREDGGRSDPGRQITTHGFFIANGPHLGGGLELPVGARADDGRLEVCVVPEMSRAKLAWAFFCLVNGWQLPAGTLEVLPGTRATIEYPDAVPFTADGDRACDSHRFDLRLRPGALSVLA